jgi:hypothetical protein
VHGSDRKDEAVRDGAAGNSSEDPAQADPDVQTVGLGTRYDVVGISPEDRHHDGGVGLHEGRAEPQHGQLLGAQVRQ